MKYEWKATARVFVPFYIAVMLFALINRVFISLNVTEGWLVLPAGLSAAGYVLAILATFALTVIIMIQRFYKNLLGDEGYLMFTLPVKTWQNIFAKMIISAVWIIVSVIVVFGSILLMVARKGFWSEVKAAFAPIQELISTLNWGSYIVWIVLGVIIALFSSIVMVYASIAIGQLFSRHKLIASFGAFLAINTVSQFIESGLLAVLYAVDPEMFNSVAAVPSDAFFKTLIIGIVILNALFGAGCYFVSQHILKKRLNLE